MVKNHWIKKTTAHFGGWILSSLCILFLLCASYFFIRYTISKAFFVGRYSQQLTDIAQERQKEILAALDDQRVKGSAIAHNPEFITSFKNLSDAFSLKKDPAQYKPQEIIIDQFFNKYKETFNYRDIFLIQPDGTIFYTNKIDLLSERNVLSKDFGTGPLGQSFERVRLTFTPDLSEFGMSWVAREPALYFVEPLFQDGIFIGALAIWLDEAILYKLIQNYSGLGKSGDIFVTKSIGDRLLFVAPSRLYANVAFKKITNPDKFAVTPARKASLGYAGSGRIIDSYGVDIIASWLFIPQLDVGLAVGIQMAEIARPLNSYAFWLGICLLLFALSFIGLIFTKRHVPHMHSILRTIFSGNTAKLLLTLGCVFSFIWSGFAVWNYYHTYNSIFDGTKKLAQIKIHAEDELITQYTNEIAKITQMIADDIKTGTLKKEDIPVRLKRDLKELSEITSITIAYAPFEFDPQTRLYAVQAQKQDGTTKIATLDIDYMIPGTGNDQQIGWYDKAIKQGAYWSDPFYQPGTTNEQVLYVLPFYKPNAPQEPMGVISVTYKLDKILSHVRAIEIGKTGYVAILSSTGRFIYHPLEQYVKDKVSLLDITREQNNQPLKDIADQMTKGKSGFGTYYDPNTRLQQWVAYESIPTVKWNIAAFFSSESLDLPVGLLHKQLMRIIIWVVLFIFLLAMLVSHVYRGALINWKEWSIFGGILFASALIIFWTIMHQSSYQPRADMVVVRDQTNLDKYIEFLKLDAQQRNEKKPLVVPTGLILSTLSFPDANKVAISGYVWQKIPQDSKLVEGVRFPEAAESNFKEVLRKKENGYEIIGWNVSATFLQKQRYSWFPFDKAHVDVIMASADFENNIILVPDFNGYQSLDIDPLPGITTKISVPGFAFEKSFFNFSVLSVADEVGLETIKGVTEKVQLHYNIILERKLTNPFIIFMLPLLIILFSTYAVFLVTFKVRSHFDVFQSLGAYTGIFFSLVLVHQTLRSQYQAGELLYIEFFFFFTYITILLLILHAIMLRVSHFTNFINEKISPYLRVLFWPIQFGLWFVVTMIIFYNMR